MQIEVTVRHASITDDLKAYAEKKARRIIKYYDKIQSVRVVLDRTGAGFECEIIADLEHMHDLVGRTAGEDLRCVIDQAADRVERQLVEHKDRTRHRKGRGPGPHQPTRV